MIYMFFYIRAVVGLGISEPSTVASHGWDRPVRSRIIARFLCPLVQGLSQSSAEVRWLGAKLFGDLWLVVLARAMFLVGYNTWGPKPQILRYLCWIFLFDLFGMVKTWPLSEAVGDLHVGDQKVTAWISWDKTVWWILLKQDWKLLKARRLLWILLIQPTIWKFEISQQSCCWNNQPIVNDVNGWFGFQWFGYVESLGT